MEEGIRGLDQSWDRLGFGPAYERPAQAEELERRYGIRLPADFKAYLTTRVPLEDFWDFQGITWWQLARIKNLSEECGTPTSDEQGKGEVAGEADRYLVFADYLDWCYAYAICCSEGVNRGKVALISSTDRFVAPSFSSFVNLAADDSLRLHSPGGDEFTDLL